MLYSFVSADRRATVRTTTSLSHAAIRQKKILHLSLYYFFVLLVSLTILSVYLIRLLYLFYCILGCCPRAGHLAAVAFAPLLDLRCCHCLAVPRFGNSSRFPCCLCFAKPRYTERNLRWLQRFTFHTFHTLLATLC